MSNYNNLAKMYEWCAGLVDFFPASAPHLFVTSFRAKKFKIIFSHQEVALESWSYNYFNQNRTQYRTVFRKKYTKHSLFILPIINNELWALRILWRHVCDVIFCVGSFDWSSSSNIWRKQQPTQNEDAAKRHVYCCYTLGV